MPNEQTYGDNDKEKLPKEQKEETLKGIGLKDEPILIIYYLVYSTL